MKPSRYERSPAFDPLDIASLEVWKQDQAGDNSARRARILQNLPIAVERELTPRQREILRMRFSDDMTVSEIAAELDVCKSTVSRSLARSLERLYKALRYSL